MRGKAVFTASPPLDMAYTVYCHENKSNGKLYFGITKKSTRRRWGNGRGYDNQSVMRRAIEKYGWDGFEHIILFTGLSEEEAKKMEIDLIREFKTQDKRYGYNMTAGGDNSPIMKGEDSPVSRPIIVFNLDGSFDAEFQTLTEAADYLGVSRGTVCEVARGHQKTTSGHFCMYKDECNNPQKQPSRVVGDMSARFKPVSQYDLDGMYIQSFPSVKDAAERTGIRKTDISSVLSGRQHEAHGFQFRYDDGCRDNIERAIRKGEANRGENHYGARSVELYNVHTGEIVKKYGTIKDAAKGEMIPYSRIESDCRSDRKSKRDYRWRYAD